MLYHLPICHLHRTAAASPAPVTHDWLPGAWLGQLGSSLPGYPFDDWRRHLTILSTQGCAAHNNEVLYKSEAYIWKSRHDVLHKILKYWGKQDCGKVWKHIQLFWLRPTRAIDRWTEINTAYSAPPYNAIEGITYLAHSLSCSCDHSGPVKVEIIW